MTGYCVQCGQPILRTGRCRFEHAPPTGESHQDSYGAGAALEGPEPDGIARAERRLPVGAPERAIALPKAGAVRRLAAAGVEFMIYLLALWVVIVISVMTSFVFGIVGPVLVCALVAVRDLRGGAYSLNKRIAGLRVVDVKTGLAAGTAQALMRNSYYLALLLVMAFPAVELLAVWPFKMLIAIDVLLVLVNPAGRRLGDFIAGTQVVTERVRR